MGVDISKWGWTKWIGMPVDLHRQPFGLVFSLRNFKTISRQVGVSLSFIVNKQSKSAAPELLLGEKIFKTSSATGVTTDISFGFS